MIELEWNEDKRRANWKKHGLDFDDLLAFRWEAAQVTLDDRFAYREDRMIATGMYRGDVHVVVYTDRSFVRRIISFRKATRHEAQTYYEERKDRS